MAGRILIVDAVATNRIILKVKLGTACYRVLQAASGDEALALARSGAPDLVLIDRDLPGRDGVATCAALRADPLTADLPVLVTLPAGDAGGRRAALEAGADALVEKPVDDSLLLARIRNLLRAAARRRDLRPAPDAEAALGFAEAPPGFDRPARIAVIGASAPRALEWQNRIDRLGGHFCDAHEAQGALERLGRTAPPDVVLIDPGAGGAAQGLRLASELQSRPDTRDAAFVMVTDPADPASAILALDLGIADLIEPGLNGAELALRLDRLIRQKRETDRLRTALDDGIRMAVIDPLTGLHNRRFALSRLEAIAREAAAAGDPFAVMVLDLDRFKQVNDRHGHAAGDAVLQAVARRIRAALRKRDLIARIGGEEFLVALPGAGLPLARDLAERLRMAVSADPVTLPDGKGAIEVTLSIGLTIGGPPDPVEDAARAAIDRADRALYAAKSGGRDKVTVGRSAA